MIDPTRAREIQSGKLGRAGLVCRFDPSGKFVAVGGMNGQVTVAAFTDGKLAEPVHVPGHRGWVAALVFHPDGRQLFTADYTGQVHAWQFTGTLQTPQWTQAAHPTWIRTLAVSPDGSLLATGGNDSIVRCWSTADGKLVRELTGHTTHIYGAAFHPSGQHLVTADLRGIIKHWEVATWQPVRELDVKFMYGEQGDVRLSGVRWLTFHPAGHLLACAGISSFSGLGDGIGTPTVTLLDWQTGQTNLVLLPKESHRSFVSAAGFHPAGYVIGATGGVDGGMLYFWKPDVAQAIFQLKLAQSAWGLDLHPDGRYLAAVHHDSALRMFDLSTLANP